MRDRITRLDNLDGAWPGGGANISLRDPNGDRAMWDQIGSGTNWEDGLWNVFRDDAGNPYGTELPDLVVFITDGEPTRVRDGRADPTVRAIRRRRTPRRPSPTSVAPRAPG